MQIVASILWRRLDAEGHDACRLQRSDDAWQLDGAAVFRHDDGRPVQLHYRVRCDEHWQTRWATVRGWIGGFDIDLRIAHDERAGWTLNDRPVPEVAHCIDLDLGFTPATNTIALRRRPLPIGEAMDAPAAWLDLEQDRMEVLLQRYERRGPRQVWYEAERFGYAALLDVSGEGWVLRYPGLWQADGCV